MYRAYPEDLRPSTLAHVFSHFGTGLELGIPCVMLASYFSPAWATVGLIMVLMLHAYIVSNVPMGVPNEWNFAVAYGAFVVFAPDTTRVDWQIESSLLPSLFLCRTLDPTLRQSETRACLLFTLDALLCRQLALQHLAFQGRCSQKVEIYQGKLWLAG